MTLTAPAEPPAPGADPFIPAAPARIDHWLPAWRLLVGESARNPLLNWPRQAFEEPYKLYRVLGRRFHMVNDPAAIQRVFLDNVANYPKPSIVRRVIAQVTGDSLLNAEGEAWRGQRQVMAPVFTPAAVGEFIPVFSHAARQAADAWGERAGRIEVHDEATRVTFAIISRSLFSDEPSLTSQEAGAHISAALAAAGQPTIAKVLGQPWLDQSATARRGAAGRRFLRSRMATFIQQRQATADPPQDFITRILRAFGEQRPAPEAARLAMDNAVTFFLAGHETTANALTWTLYLLSHAQDWQDRCAAEAMASDEPLTAPDVLSRSPTLRMVLEEAMRLYPPAPRMDRVALRDDELCGEPIGKGDVVTIWPWAVHRHKRLWRNPDAFDPDNFSPEAKAGRHRYQYIPFGAGPRTCIGAQFAMVEALVILRHWLARYRFTPVAGCPVKPFANVTLRPEGGLPLQVAPRRG